VPENREVVPENRTINSKRLSSSRLAALATEPATAHDVSFNPSALAPGFDMVRKLKPPSKAVPSEVKYGNALTVYYLDGDERRAVRKFIAVNESYVRKSVKSINSPIFRSFDEFLQTLFFEEWQFEWYKRLDSYEGSDSNE